MILSFSQIPIYKSINYNDGVWLQSLYRKSILAKGLYCLVCCKIKPDTLRSKYETEFACILTINMFKVKNTFFLDFHGMCPMMNMKQINSLKYAIFSQCLLTFFYQKVLKKISTCIILTEQLTFIISFFLIMNYILPFYKIYNK